MSKDIIGAAAPSADPILALAAALGQFCATVPADEYGKWMEFSAKVLLDFDMVDVRDVRMVEVQTTQPQAAIKVTEMVELRRLAMEATPGPWLHRYDPGNPVGVQHGVKLAGEFGAWVCDCLDNADKREGAIPAGDRNAEFIAATNPAAILRLLDALAAPAPTVAAPSDEVKKLWALIDEYAGYRAEYQQSTARHLAKAQRENVENVRAEINNAFQRLAAPTGASQSADWLAVPYITGRAMQGRRDLDDEEFVNRARLAEFATPPAAMPAQASLVPFDGDLKELARAFQSAAIAGEPVTVSSQAAMNLFCAMTTSPDPAPISEASAAAELNAEYSEYLDWCVSKGKESMLFSHFKSMWVNCGLGLTQPGTPYGPICMPPQPEAKAEQSGDEAYIDTMLRELIGIANSTRRGVGERVSEMRKLASTYQRKRATASASATSATQELAERLKDLGITKWNHFPGTNPNATPDEVAAELLKALDTVMAAPAPRTSIGDDEFILHVRVLADSLDWCEVEWDYEAQKKFAFGIKAFLESYTLKGKP